MAKGDFTITIAVTPENEAFLSEEAMRRNTSRREVINEALDLLREKVEAAKAA